MTTDILKKGSAALLAALIAVPLPEAALFAAETAAPAAAAKTVSLDAVDVAEDSVRLHVTGAAKYSSLVTANPPRIVVDFQDTEYTAGTKSLAGKGKFLKAVRSGQFQRNPMVVRVVLDLNEMTGYKVVKNGDEIVVTLGGSAGESAKTAPASAPKTAAAPPPAPAPAASTDTAKTAAAKPARPKVKAPVPATTAPAPASAAPAVAAATPAPSNPLAHVGEKDGMTTQASPELAEIADKTDVARPENEPAREPAATTQLAAVGKPRMARPDIMSRLPRDLVTLDFDNTDIRDVIKLLATKAKVNIIYGPDVAGAVTLHLSDVPFNDAFRTILTMMGFATTQVGDNILRVLTPAALTRSQTAAATVTKVIPLNYAKASELLPTINTIRVAEGRTGQTVANDKTNSLIVTESVEGMLATERLIQQLDIRPKQVLIEAKLVEVGLNNSLHYGIQWDYLGVDQGKIGGKQGTNLIGTLTPPVPAGATTPPLDNNATGATPSVGSAGRGTGVSLPATSVFGALTLGRITNNYFVSATLTAAAAQGKVKVLSDPKVATLNNQAATINVTTQIPYVTSNVASTGVQTQSVQYVTTGIQLAVTPSINADGRITLDINPNVSQPSATAAASTTGAPAIDSRNAHTNVLVRDGETVVIGGLISDSVSNQIAKIPILGDIPILGWLFKKKSVVRTRAELLIFVTPKIMPD